MIDLENKYLKRIMSVFEDSFINDNNELIVLLRYYPSDNLSFRELCDLGLGSSRNLKSVFVNEYFRLEDCENDLDLKRKILSWLSRACCKTEYSRKYDDYIHRYFRDRCNELLNVNFSENEWMKIYSRLGNDIHRDLCVKFIEGGYNLDLLD